MGRDVREAWTRIGSTDGPARRLAPAIACMAVAAVVLGGEPHGARAQTAASEVTPDTFRPAPSRALEGALVFTGEPGTQAPPGADALSIRIADVNVEGALPALAAANAAFETRLTRGRIAVSEIFDATADLEAAYAQAGYVLTRVILPAQDLADGGTLRVVVINGFVEAVDLSQVPERVRRPIETATAGLQDRPGLTRAELERRLLLAGDTAGVALGSALATGARPGGTVIALDPEYRSVTGFVGFDNLADDALGELSFNAGVELNSLLGRGETIYARISGFPERYLADDPRYRTLAAGLALPVGASGLTFNYEATLSATRPDDALAPTDSDFERHSLRLFYPWIRSRSLNVSSQVSLDLQDDEQDLLTSGGPLPLYRDAVTVLRLGTSVSAVRPSGASFDVGAFVSRGIDALGARTAQEAIGAPTPLSRAGADATFTKLVVAGFYARPLGAVDLRVSGRAQLSFGDALVTSEQFSITGSQEISAFDAGGLRGDEGWVLRGEVARTLETAVAGRPLLVAPYAFAALGEVTRESPSAVESRRTGAAAYGIGLDITARTGSRFDAATLRVEYGIGERDDDGADDKKLSVFGTYRF